MDLWKYYETKHGFKVHSYSFKPLTFQDGICGTIRMRKRIKPSKLATGIINTVKKWF
jgi:hypothetical protein